MKDLFLVILVIGAVLFSIGVVLHEKTVLYDQSIFYKISSFNQEKFRDSLYVEKYQKLLTPFIYDNMIGFYSYNTMRVDQYYSQIDSIIYYSYYTCKKYNMDLIWFLSMIYQESHFFPKALSHKNAYGLTQVTFYAVDSYNIYFNTNYSMKDMFNIKNNIEVGVWYLKQKLLESNLSLRIAFGKYYAGNYWMHYPQYEKGIRKKRQELLNLLQGDTI